MNTQELETEGFRAWHKFNRRTKAELLDCAPLSFGAYIIRALAPVKRSRGESDIVYVGSACNQRGLRGRIEQFFSPGQEQLTNKRILELIGESDDYEVGWVQTRTTSEAVDFKQHLMGRYCADHGERPPENLRG